MTPEDYPCQQVVEQLTDYLERSLPAETYELITDHLGICEDCATYLSQLEVVISMLGGIDHRPVEAPVVDRLATTFRAARERPS